MIFDIKRYAINDGPGIRVTLFLKGCPLRCVWCHNPEGYTPGREKMYKRQKCIGCQTCVEACPRGALRLTPEGIVSDATRCTLCGACAEACPTRALEMSGRDWDMAALMAEVEKERDVMEESGGGVTLCGGEPLLQGPYCLRLLDELGRRRFHRCVDTSLYAEPQLVDDVMARSELLLIDLKHTDSEAHRRFTGVGNERILTNIRRVAEAGHPYWIRIPLIEGANADDDNLRRSADFLATLPTRPEWVNLLPYHDVARGKHERRGTLYNPQHIPLATPATERQEAALRLFAARQLRAKIGG